MGEADHRGWLRAILALVAWSSVVNGQCTAPDEITGLTAYTVLDGHYIVYTCTDVSTTFSSDDTAIASKCVGGEWTPVNATCIQSSDTAAATCATAFVPPEDTTQGTSLKDDAFLSYECVEGKSWLSGDRFKISQCRAGEWTPIWDICDEGCPVPRDCGDVAALGLEENGEYLVIPSGLLDGNIHTVYCSLNATEEENGAGWTYIFRNYDTETSKLNQDYIDGYEEWTTPDVNYFIGLDFLSEISKPIGDTPAGMVMEILFYNSMDEIMFHSTYSNFSVGSSPAFPIMTLGTYHGNAGDAMCPHLNTEFLFQEDGNTAGLAWWGVTSETWESFSSMHGNFLTSAKKWQPMENETDISQVQIRIRSIEDDAETVCPPMVGSEVWWKHTNQTIPYSRQAGTVVTWQCLDSLFMEGEEDGTRTHEGTATCEAGTPPTWDYNVILPCTLQCPDQFELTEDGKRCLMFSAEEAATGYLEASTGCLALNSSLAVMQFPGDTSPAEDGFNYYVNHAMRGVEQTAVNAPLPTDFNCTESGCANSADLPCTVVTSGDLFTPVACEDPARYICEIPNWCPEFYFPLEGACYAVFDQTPDLLEAYEKCLSEGGTLAFPTTVQRANILKEELSVLYEAEIADGAQLTFFTGLNNVDGTWTAGEAYTMGDLLSELDTGSDLKFRTLDLTASPSMFVPADSTAGPGHPVCEYPGPNSCLTNPPEASENMTANWDNTTVALSSSALYECKHGYFVDGNISFVNQSIDCSGILGGWYPALKPCLRVPVCEGLAPNVSSLSIVSSNDEESLFLDGIFSYACPQGMMMADMNTTLNTTCVGTDSGYGFDHLETVSCTFCMENVTHGNSTSSWVSTESYDFGAEVEVTCDEGFEYEMGLINQTVSCSDSGWNYTGILPCLPACTENPPEIAATIQDFNVSANAIGTTLTYTCLPGYYFVPSPDLPNVTNEAQVVCNGSGIWESSRGEELLNCTQVCLMDPPPLPANSNSTWDGVSKGEVDDMVTYTCDPDYLFANFSPTWIVTCNGTEWGPLDPAQFTCDKACMTDPVADIGGALPVNWTATYGWLDDTIQYLCPNGTANVDGNFSTTVACKDTGWAPAPTDFLCEPSCMEPPPVPPTMAHYNFTGDIREGVVILYSCEGGFKHYNEKELTSVCEDHVWTIPSITECLTVTTPGPSTIPPYVLISLGENSLHYSDTTSNTWSEIHGVEFVDVNGIEDNYHLVTGPQGFGYGTGLRSENQQCLQKSNNASNTQLCVLNPVYCSEGLSFSIWERPYIFTNVMDSIDLEGDDYTYVFSTGGDTAGHPGIAVMHHEHWLAALVSTGTKYWKVAVLGAVKSGEWNNIGVTWSESNGLKLFVNLTQVGGAAEPVTGIPQRMPVDPHEILIGCHRDGSNLEFRGFNNADFDEFAIWPMELNGSHVEWLAGGYQDNFTEVTPAMAVDIASRMDMRDPDQRYSISVMLDVVIDGLSTSSVDPTAASVSGVSSTASSPIFINHLTTPQWDADSVNELIDVSQVLRLILDTKNLPLRQDMDQSITDHKTARILDSLLSDDKAWTWMGVQAKTDEQGAMQIIQDYSKYMNWIMRSTEFPNNTEPTCHDTNTVNLLSEYCLMTVSDMKERPMYQRPRYNQGNLKKYKDLWLMPYDRAAFRTGMFQDDECLDRPVGVHITVYNSVSSYAHTGINPAELSTHPIYAIDSRILTYEVTAQPEFHSDGSVDTSQPLCIPDPEFLRNNPVFFKMEHLTKTEAVRKLLFHENELVTDIAVRRCVRWNPELSDFGAWDPSGCVVVETTEHFTKCACENFGTYSILAEKTEEISVPDEPGWLPILKYVLYGLSAVAIVLYIIVVVIAGDLKDQFHLMGLNLAVSLVLGSAVMVISDFDSVRTDRHSCVAFGTMIQFFYGATGFWMFSLGHASFKAITAGIIGGRLQPYMLISWGGSLTLVGIPFVGYLHDLGTDPRCFIGWINTVKIIFFLPQVFFAGCALFFAIVILCNLSTPALRKENLIEDYGSFCRGAAMLLILLSTTWIFGLFAYVRFEFTEPDFYPIFQVLNATAGLALFLFIGLGSNRFRVFVTGKAMLRRNKLKSQAFGLPDSPDQDPADQVSNIPTKP